MRTKQFTRTALIALALAALSGTTCSLEYSHYGSDDIGSLQYKLGWLMENGEDNTTYTIGVTRDEGLGWFGTYDNKNITIRLKGIGGNRTINGGLNVPNGVTLVLDDNITVRGGIDVGDVGSERAALIMNAGSAVSGEVCVGRNGIRGTFTFTMNDGSAITGGWVIVANGAFTMNGGTISGSTGDGVLVSGTFTMNGGTISGNSSSGVNNQRGTFTMNGGTISGNSSSGVNNEGGTFTMNSGTISGNTSRNTGGVSVSLGATFTMNGGTIRDNTASGSNKALAYGGGVGVQGTFTMNGGTICGNTATSPDGSFYGGGVGCTNGGTFTMHGGTIRDNTAYGIGHGGGGGVGVEESGTFTMDGGTISGNTVSSYSDNAYGGGVYINDNYYAFSSITFTKTGGTIYGYSADDTANSNVVKDFVNAVLNDHGHAVYADDYGDSSSNKRRETSAGPGVNLYWNNGTFSGGWDD